MTAVLDGTGYLVGDTALAIMLTLSAILTYSRVAFEVGARRLPVPRLIVALGFTVWAMRFWYTILVGGDVIVAPLSMLSIAMVTSGYCTIQMIGIHRSVQMQRVPIFCFRDPNWPCMREDRIHEAIQEQMKGKA